MNKDFLHVERIRNIYRPLDERIADALEVERELSRDELHRQTARCMDCGIPFCHGTGCPLCNTIPEINAAVHRGDLRTAWELLSATSPMPEFTARVCPALCEGSCTVSLVTQPVMVRQIEKRVVEYAFAQHWVEPIRHARANGHRVAVVGSGPAGLAAAIELCRRGYAVTVFERKAGFGGLLRYGIPSFKLEKSVIDRRIALMVASGIAFESDTEIGKDISVDYLSQRYDAVIIATGTPVPRDIDIPGRNLRGIHFALDFLNGEISAKGRHVVVVGGGDTGSDCVGLSVRQGAQSITQLEIMPAPPSGRSASTPWPAWPYQLRTSSSQQEGGTRRWSLRSERFISSDRTNVSGVEVTEVEWAFAADGRPVKIVATKNRETLSADLVLLAMGFLKPEHAYGHPNIFVVGDAAKGASLVVRAIADAVEIIGKVDGFIRKLE